MGDSGGCSGRAAEHGHTALMQGAEKSLWAWMKILATESAGVSHAIQIIEDCYLAGSSDSFVRRHRCHRF